MAMIKLDIISGFLGVGKTTLIKRYLQTLAKEREKVVLIENDFGAIGIDKNLFSNAGLKIYEINKGCLCCNLKGTFIHTLIEIAENIKPNRVIIEPSGIFILSEIFELFRYYQIHENYLLNSVVTVIDGLHYHTHQTCYGNFFLDQINNATSLWLSKTEAMTATEVLAAVTELMNTYPGKKVVATSCENLTDGDILDIIQNPEKISGTNGEGNSIKSIKQQRSHAGFSSHAFYGREELSAEGITEKLKLLHSEEFGNIIRAKGLIKDVNDKENFWEFHYVEGDIEITCKKQKDLKAALCFIGRDLNRESLESLFQ